MGTRNSKNKPQLVHGTQEKAAEQAKLPKRVLFLGAGGTGKSTFLRCARQICGVDTQHERLQYVPIFYQNVVWTMLMILESSNLDSKILGPSYDLVRAEGSLETAKHALNLWNNPLVREAARNPDYLKHRATGIEEQLFGHLREMVKEDWVPTDEQLLLVRVRTTGIVEGDLNYGKLSIRTVDVGGQREERKKWIHCFEGLKAVIYFAAPGAFEESLIEDNGTNKLNEDFQLYAEIGRSRWFTNIHVICVLNKMDRFPTEPPLTLAQLEQACPFLVNSLLTMIIEFTGSYMTPEQILLLETSLQKKMNEGETPHDFVHRCFQSVRAHARLVDCVSIDRNSVENALDIIGEILQHPHSSPQIVADNDASS